MGVVGARPALSLWGALGSRYPSVPACDLEQPPGSALCPLCAQDFRGTASSVTCGNFQPMGHGQPQREEAPSPSRPTPPSLAQSWGWPGRGPGWLPRVGAGACKLTSQPGSFGLLCGCYLSAPRAPVRPEVSRQRAARRHSPTFGNRDEC